MRSSGDMHYQGEPLTLFLTDEVIDAVPPVGMAEPLPCPDDLPPAARPMFALLADEGRGRYRMEDIYAVSELAMLATELDHWDRQRLELLGVAGREDDYDALCSRTAKLSHRARVLRDRLGCNPTARFSVASRRRGTMSYKRSGGARNMDQAERQVIAALEESGRIPPLPPAADHGGE